MNIEASLHYIPEYSTRKFQMVYTKWTWIVKHYTSSSESAYWSNSNSFHMYIPKTVVSWRKIKYIHLVRKLLPSVLKVKKIDEVSNDLTSPPKYVIYKSNLALWRSVFFFCLPEVDFEQSFIYLRHMDVKWRTQIWGRLWKKH